MSSQHSKLTEQTATDLHSAAIHLLRRLRMPDAQSGLSPARLSVLSILVFSGDKSPGELAQVEQVRPPTMTKLVQGLEHDGLVKRVAGKSDKRVSLIKVTPKGRRILIDAQQRRLALLQTSIGKLGKPEIKLLADAAVLMEKIAAAE